MLSPSVGWTRVGQGTINVLPPVVTGVSATGYGVGNGINLKGGDPVKLELQGTGLMAGRGFVKVSTAPCTADGSTDVVGGDAHALEWANSDATRGGVRVTLEHLTALQGTLAVCFSHTNATHGFSPTPVTSAVFVPRVAQSFSPTSDLVPGVPRSFTISGTNFPVAGSGMKMYARLSSSCGGSSDSSDVPGGDAREVTVDVGGVSGTVEFTAEPVILTVESVLVAARGSGYVNGAAVISGGGGSAASGVFVVDPVDGGVKSTFMINRGSGYTSTPSVDVAFSGAKVCISGSAVGATPTEGCPQTNRVTSIVQMSGRTRNCQVMMISPRPFHSSQLGCAGHGPNALGSSIPIAVRVCAHPKP